MKYYITRGILVLAALLVAVFVLVMLTAPAKAQPQLTPSTTTVSVAEEGKDNLTASYAFYTNCTWTTGGKTYTNRLTVKVVTSGQVKYITELRLYTNYPNGAYVDMYWGNGSFRVNTNGGAHGAGNYSGWKATAGTGYRAEHGYSVNNWVDKKCTVRGTV